MITRSIAVVAFVISCGAAPCRAGPNEASMAAYRAYAKAQADDLVDQTRGWARAIKAGYLDSAQLTYAIAHRYLLRIEPIVKSARALGEHMDGSADLQARKEVDPGFSGFHRIEYGLFINRSTDGLSDLAERLAQDARTLRSQVASLDLTPAMLLDGTIANLEDIAAKSLSGDEERYSRTDLWDFEANIEGARQVVAVLRAQPLTRDASTFDTLDQHFAKTAALLDTHKAGCGFQAYDELSRAERTALSMSFGALAKELSTLRGAVAMD